MLTCLCFLLAGLSNGIMDTLVHHYHGSYFSTLPSQEWWNPELSWLNKYNYPSRFLRFVARHVPRFTDGWHFFKGLTLDLVCLGAVIYWQPGLVDNVWLDGAVVFLVLRVACFGLAFTLLYNLLEPKEKPQ
jgi:hypothetical protein